MITMKKGSEQELTLKLNSLELQRQLELAEAEKSRH